jgi:RNA polymerase sigma-70 factor, ECF subfamily
MANQNFQDCITAGSHPVNEVEHALVAAAQSGDSDACDALCRLHSKRVLKTVMRIVGDPSDAEDVAQETFLRAFANIEKFQQQSAFTTWLTTIAINCALMLLRRKRHGVEGHLHAPSSPDEEMPFDFEAVDPSPLDIMHEMELDCAMRRAISMLPSNLQEVVLIRCYQEWSTKETAAALGLTESAVKTRLRRARSRLRQKLSTRLRSVA